AMLVALEEHLDPPQIVIIRGSEATHWQRELDKIYAPRRLIFAIPADVKDLPAAIADKKLVGNTVAYLCTGMTCSAPLQSLEALTALAV
ncbi:MAG: thioredoxin domain-containing protein, partial [Povalibacter sp.]